MDKKIKINFLFNTIKTVVTVIFPIISFPYVSRVLGVEGVGKFQYCNSIISYFVLFASLGIASYSVREGVKYKSDRKKYSKFVKEMFTINMITTMLAYIVLIICFLCGAYEGKRDIMLATSLLIMATTLCMDWLYQAMEEYVYMSVRTILIQVLSLIMMFVFIKDEGDVLIYSLISVFSYKGYCFFNMVHARKYVDFGVKCKLELKKHLKPILVIFGATVSVSIYMNMDVVMLGMFCGDYEVGLYTAAVKVNMVVKNVIASSGAVVLPRLVLYLAEKKQDEYEKLFKQGAELNMFFSVASAVGLAVLSRPIILLFSGEEFASAVVTGQILAIRLVFSAIDNIFYNQVLIPMGREKEACIGTMAGAVANLVLNMLLIPILQTEGAAIATVLSEAVVFVYFIFATKKLINLKKVLSGAPYFLFAAAVMGGVVWFGMSIVKNVIMQVVVLIPVGAACYIAVLYVCNKVRKEEDRFAIM